MVDELRNRPVEHRRISALYVAKVIDARELRFPAHGLADVVRRVLDPLALEPVRVAFRVHEILKIKCVCDVINVLILSTF